MYSVNKGDILNRIKQRKGFTTDAELAAFFEVGKSTISNWYKRNSIDYDLLFSKCEQEDLNWLLTGKGEMLKQDIVQSHVDDADTLLNEVKDSLKDDRKTNMLLQLIMDNSKLVDANVKLAEANLILAETNARLSQEIINSKKEEESHTAAAV